MNYATKYILCFLLLAVTFPLMAQKVNLKTANAKYATTLSQQDRETIIATVKSLLDEYVEAATLLDPAKRQITGASINRFRDLFNPTATVVKDYEEFYQGELVNVRVYADGAFNRMLRKGIKVKVESADLVEIDYDPAGYWVVNLEVQKVFYNAVTADQKVKEVPSGRYMKQAIKIDVKTTDLDRAKISSIKCIGCDTEFADNYVRYVGPSVGVFTGSFSPSLSAYWNNNHASASSLETSAELGFSFGADFMTNAFAAKRSPKKNLFLTAGLRYSLYRMSTEMNDFSLDPFSDTATIDAISLPYARSAREITVKENLSFGVVEIPLGVAYRFKKGIKSDLMVGVKLVPSFVLSGSGDIDGTGTYDAEITEAMWRLLEAGASNPDQTAEQIKFGPFQAGENQTISESADPSTAGFVLSAQLSPTYFYHFSEDDSSWSLMLALDLNFHLGSFLKHDDANDDILKFKDDYQTSLLQHYTDGMSGLTFGLRIGLQHRLTRNP